MKKRLAALLLAIMTIFLASCEKEFENVDEGFYDEATGITYVTSNSPVQPINCEEG